MAGGVETIREFLVSLGYRQDENALKKFTDGIDKATKRVFALAAAVEATAVTVAIGVARWASNLESLYFASLRTGSTVANLKALDRTAQNFGASAGEALDSIEGIAEAIRKNPGNVGLLEGLGVQLKRAKDGTIDTADALLQLSKIFRSQPIYLSEQYAALLGINERTLLAMRNGDFSKEFERIRGELSKTDWRKAAEDAHKFMVNLRDTITLFQSIGARVTDNILQKFGFKNLEEFNQWLDAHQEEIVKKVNHVIDEIISGAEYLKTKLTELIAAYKTADAATGGWLSNLIIIAGLLKVTGAGSVIGGVLSLSAAIFKLGGGLVTVSVSAAALVASLTAAYSAYKLFKGEDASNFISDLANRFTGGEGGGKDSIGTRLYNFFHRGQTALDFFQNRGYSRAQATGIVANLQAESGLHPGAEGDNGRALGLAQWHAARQKEFQRIFGHSLKDSSFMEQLEFIDRELRAHPEYGRALLRAAQTPEDAARIVSRYYERPAAGAAAAEERARIAGNLNLSQKTDIHVYGSEPHSTAERVTQQQKQVNSEMARNFAPAVK